MPRPERLSVPNGYDRGRLSGHRLLGSVLVLGQVATKSDLDALRLEQQKEVEQLRLEVLQMETRLLRWHLGVMAWCRRGRSYAHTGWLSVRGADQAASIFTP